MLVQHHMSLIWICIVCCICLLWQCEANNNNHLTVELVEKHFSAYAKEYPRQCSTKWQEEYTAFHKKMLGEDKPKLLVAIPNLSGMADRIIGYVTTCMIAYLTDRAVQFGNREPLPYFETVFTSPNINWTRAADPEWIIEPLKHKAKDRNYNSSILETKQYFAVNTIDDYRLLDKLLRQNLFELMGKDYLTTFIAINRGKTIRMFENTNHFAKLNATGMSSNTAFGCILSYLLQPKPHIFLHTPIPFMKMTDPSKHVLKIAIQIRAGDNYLQNANHNININDFKGFFSCADQIEKFTMAKSDNQYTSVVWYLVTDSVPLRQAALKEYGDKKIVTVADSIVVEHSSKESSVCKEGCKVSNVGFETAAAEWWLMMFAKYHVISEYSGFGRSAAMASLNPNSIFTIRYKQMSKPATCNENSFTDLENLSYDWSGI